MMYFKIVENFGPDSGKAWQEYLQWRNADFTRFDSVDSSLRPDLFLPESDDDWNNCIKEDYKLNLITNIDYAKEVLRQKQSAAIVGVEIELDAEPSETKDLLGFDVIDEYCATSLLTNWGVNDLSFIDDHLESNGLIASYTKALEVRDQLLEQYSEDSHASCCSIWAIYEVRT